MSHIWEYYKRLKQQQKDFVHLSCSIDRTHVYMQPTCVSYFCGVILFLWCHLIFVVSSYFCGVKRRERDI
jgi:hypothetical protein